jgi:hypothetical protein
MIIERDNNISNKYVLGLKSTEISMEGLKIMNDVIINKMKYYH